MLYPKNVKLIFKFSIIGIVFNWVGLAVLTVTLCVIAEIQFKFQIYENNRSESIISNLTRDSMVESSEAL